STALFCLPSSPTFPLYPSFFLPILTPPKSTLFPYTTLFRSMEPVVVQSPRQVPHLVGGVALRRGQVDGSDQVGARTGPTRRPGQDRKSTRLNSSHVAISYAVFCLKKKKKKKQRETVHDMKRT